MSYEQLPFDHSPLTALVSQITEIVQQARSHVRQSVNQAMVSSYWEIGRLIVEHEQQGQARAAYGQRQLAELSARLTELFGKGFDERNLRHMRAFFLCFPIRDAVRSESGWTHYRILLRVENPSAREWYLHEAISQNWSSRAGAANWRVVLRTLVEQQRQSVGRDRGRAAYRPAC
jgi:hypothetical protein